MKITAGFLFIAAGLWGGVLALSFPRPAGLWVAVLLALLGLGSILFRRIREL